MNSSQEQQRPQRNFSNLRWVKSSASFSNGNCVEVASLLCDTSRMLVRDTKLADSPVLVFPAAAWAAFTASLKDGPGRPLNDRRRRWAVVDA